MANVETELKSLTDMITTMFGSEFVEYIKEKHGNLRTFYETSTAITQCNNVAGPVVRNKTPCWICGFIIPPTPGPEHGFAPECEHVFPIAQALFFIGIYSSDVKDNEAYKEKLKLEYDWAHRVCNQIKNDSHFIEHDLSRPNGRWDISRVKITAFLNKILKDGNKYGGGGDLIRKEIQTNKMTTDSWILKQTDYIEQRSRAILSTIKPHDENLWILATVSDLTLDYQLSGFVPEAIPPVDKIAQPGTVIAGNQRIVEEIYSKWAEFLLKHVHTFMISYLEERIKRYTFEEKAVRVQKIIACTDQSIIQRVGAHVWNIYNQIPNNASKDTHFIEAIQYMILSVVLERLKRIFTDDTDLQSPALQKLGNEITRNIVIIRDIWTANNIGNGIQYLDSIISTNLKGARRRC